MAGNSPVSSHGCKFPLSVAKEVAGKPGLFIPGRKLYFRYSSQGVDHDDALRLRQSFSAGSRRTRTLTSRWSGWSAPAAPWAMSRSEEASGAKNDRSGLLELLDLVVAGDTLVVNKIDRLSRGLTYGLQVLDDLHLRGVEFRSLAEDFDTATARSITSRNSVSMAEVPGPAMLVILASISSMKARRRQWENGSGRSMWILTSGAKSL